MDNVEIFGQSSVIPMTICLNSDRMRLGTVISAYKHFKKGDTGLTNVINSKDFWQYNMNKFQYVKSIRAKSWKDIFAVIGLEAHLKMIKARITQDKVALVFMRAL